MTSKTTFDADTKVGLVLSGGGARGAYQAGVLQALAEIRASRAECRPFRIITGVSAGAINAAYLAANCDTELEASKSLASLWRQLTSEQVFKTDVFSLGRIGLKWFSDATVGALYRHKQARSLLDTAPLRELLAKHIKFDRIPAHVASSRLEAFSITALNYSNAHNISFVMANENLRMWERSRRKAVPAPIGVEHVMASAAIPLFFPPVKIESEFFGDGCLRNTAPLSPAIHLGAKKLIVISVRRPEEKAVHVAAGMEPSVARVLGVMLNALLMDAIEFDMERLSRINSTLDYVPGNIRNDLSLRKISSLWIRPSEDIGYLASGQFRRLPKSIRYLMAGLGSSREASELTSYLLFDPEYCGRLIDLGYKDTIARADEIAAFLAD